MATGNVLKLKFITETGKSFTLSWSASQHAAKKALPMKKAARRKKAAKPL